MGLKLRNSKIYAPKDTVEVLGVKTPIIYSIDELPLGTQTECNDLLLALGSGNIGPTQWSVRMFCLATQLNRNPNDRITWGELSKLQLDPEDEEELIKGALQVVQPLVDKMNSSNTSGETTDPKAI